MKIQRYFGLLLVASVMCFLYLALNSRLAESELFQDPATVLDRYSRQVSGILRAYESVEFSGDGLTSESEGITRNMFSRLDHEDDDTFLELRTLVNKLTNKTASRTDNEITDTTEESGETTENRGLEEGTEGKQRNVLHPESCQPHKNIVFLKTHKTASSTLTNIFNRYADLRELKVALPLPGFNRFRWPLYFHWTAVDLYRLSGEYANILCNHARYYKPTMEQVMGLGTKYITILRNPIEQFESTFDYMELSTFLGLGNVPNPMERFLRMPYRYLRNVTRHMHFPDSLNLARNGMFFDLGLNPRSYDNQTKVLEEISKLDREFSLVLIMEYFDESLVLLKRELCWDLEDIVYAKFNQRHARRKLERITPNLKRMIEAWNSADVLLYRHFNRTFWNKIKQQGQEFYKDLEEFQQKNSELQKECISPVEVKEKAFRLTKDVRGLQLNPSVSSFDRYFCNKIITNEVDYIKYFRLKFHPLFGYQRLLQNELAQKTRGRTRDIHSINAPITIETHIQKEREKKQKPVVQFVYIPPVSAPLQIINEVINEEETVDPVNPRRTYRRQTRRHLR